MNDQTHTETEAAAPSTSAQVPAPAAGPSAVPQANEQAPLGFLGQIQSHLDSLRSMVGQHAQTQADLIAREAELDRRREEANARDASLQTLAAAIRARELELESRETAAASADAELAARAQALNQQAREIEDARNASAQEALRAKDELETARAEAFRTLTSAEDLQKAAQAESARAREAAARAESEATSARESTAQAAAQITELREALARTDAQAIAAREALGRAAEDRELRTRQAEHELTQRLEAEKARADRLEAELAEAQRLLTIQPAPSAQPEPADHTQHALDDAKADAQAAAERVEDLLRAIESRDDALRAATAQVGELRAMLDAAPQPADAPPALTIDPELAHRVALRRQRLERYKHLLQQQSGKIVKAKAAIQKRATECEHILAQRGKIAEGLEALAQQRRVIEARAARSGAAAIAAYTMVSLAMITGLAWGVARQMAPATFAARAEIGADGGSRQLSADELASWSAAHIALVKDPQVAAAAAENFARRGMNDLGTAAAVKSRLADRLYTQSDTPGTLILEHRAPGGERAARELETFLSALLAVCNAQREARGDGASTVITGTPAPGTEPLDSARLTYAASIAGGGLFLALGVGLGGYRVLSRAKDRFERETADPLGL